jgi:hypothetical protein
LTVLLWPQVRNYSLTKLRLILADLTALATQQFLFNNFSALAGQRVKATSHGTVAFTLTIGISPGADG